MTINLMIEYDLLAHTSRILSLILTVIFPMLTMHEISIPTIMVLYISYPHYDRL